MLVVMLLAHCLLTVCLIKIFLIMRENESKEPCTCFGPGYRKRTSVREVQICPICASSEPDIVLEELPTEPFRFETVGTDDNEAVRIRSDVSMLLHAADMAKKYGTGFVKTMVEMHRPKSSSLQSEMDLMSDAQILDTIKSRHLQSPSELIAWSEYLIDQAKSIEDEASLIALEKESASSSQEDSSSESQSE